MREFAERPGRVDLELPVQLVGRDLSSHAAVMKNIGAGGLFVVTEHVGKVGDRVGLKFALPDPTKPIAVDGEVRWIRKTASPEHGSRRTGMGLRFVGLSVGAFVVIHEFLRAHEQAGGGPAGG
jgi:uncharacterized protein (TIGR02266 family)